MSKFLFADGAEIGVYDGESVKKFSSKYIENYKKSAEEAARNRQWKKNGAGALFRGEEYRDAADMRFDCAVSGVFPTQIDGEIFYSFKMNETSGIYKKDLNDEKLTESHVVNSSDSEYSGGCLNAQDGALATSVKRNYYNADIAVFDTRSGDMRTVTDGDTLDEDPFWCAEERDILYYASRGVGRDAHGSFAGYSPSAIYRLDLGRVEVTEVKADEKYSYFKPVYYGGKLFAIKAPAKERTNPLLDIVLIPWRILQGIVGFINVFVKAFAGKSLTSAGDNPAKGRQYDSRKIVVAGNLIDVEKQSKKNASKKNKDYGFVPASWQLVEVESGEVIKNGVADFDIAEDGTFIVTNGRRIFEIKDGKCTKVCNTECCVRVSCLHSAKSSTLFGDFR